jgi:hypothetical protein
MEKVVHVIDETNPRYEKYKGFIERKDIMMGVPIAEYLTPETAKKYSIKETKDDSGTVSSTGTAGDSNKSPKLRINRR